jgi:hypothetical protein
MREPASPDEDKAPATEAVGETGGVSLVSIPDRRRIDSDVRAFLREPSTPWIVFDQEGRPPSQLAVGEVLPVAFSSVIPEHGFFPSTAIIDSIPAGAGAGTIEPSSLSLAADVLNDPMDAGLGSNAIPGARLSRRVLGAAAAAVALVSTIALGVFAVHSASQSVVSAPPGAAAQTLSAQSSPMPAELAPPELAPPAPAASASAVANAAAPATGTPPAAKWARLSVAGDARSRDVFMDGKRMLGKGTRSYTVSCGPHTIAVGTKTDTRDVDLPCTGTYELLITK